MNIFRPKENMSGFANWMKAHVEEELMQAMKFFKYIINRVEKVKLLILQGPKTEWKSVKEAFSGCI